MKTKPTNKCLHVLLVDDDPADQKLAKLALHKFGQMDVAVHVADNLSDALRCLQESTFDVVLLDLGLPESRGIETLERVRQVEDQTPIVVLTDLCDEKIALESMDKGAQDYLYKQDVAVETLARAISYAIQRQHLYRQLAAANSLLEQKNAELEKLCDTAQKFVDNVSHEFRTPLTVIKEYLSLLREGVVGKTPLDAEQCRFLDIACDRADDLNTMVDDMLDVSKLESGLLVAWRKPCRLEDIVAGVQPTLEKKAQVKGVDVQIDLDGGLPEIFCDEEKVRRVMINLLINAIKFCGDQGRVRLWARRDDLDRNVVVGVTDNGPGIDRDHLQAIFQRFKQVGLKTRGTSKGFGLGLNIAKELVDLNFGELKIESQVGHGSCFSFTLPQNDPVEITQRYLDQQQRAGLAQHVSLLRAHVDESDVHQLGGELDVLLHYLLSGNDLLIPASAGSWLLLVAKPETEIPAFLADFSRHRDEANRNRPQHDLPIVHFHFIECASVCDQPQAILENVEQALNPDVPSHV